jgi:hypothetical protein
MASMSPAQAALATERGDEGALTFGIRKRTWYVPGRLVPARGFRARDCEVGRGERRMGGMDGP